MLVQRFFCADRELVGIRSLALARASACVVGSIQPGILGRHFTGEAFESGFAARILLAQPPVKKRQWSDVGLPASITRPWGQAIEQLFTLRNRHDSENGNLTPPYVTLEREALELFKRFVNRRGDELHAERDEALRAACGKLEGGAGRMALTIHFLRWANGEVPNDQIYTLDAESMRAGITLSDWHLAEAAKVYKDLAVKRLQSQEGDLVNWLQSQGGGATAWELHSSRKGTFKTTKAAEAALNQLVEAGLGKWVTVQNPKGGRRRQTFRLGA